MVLDTKGLVVGSCHEWRGPRMGENKGYRCVECGSAVESAKDMDKVAKCRDRLIPKSWLPEQLIRE